MRDGLNILLVDDEEDDVQLAREAFKRGRIMNRLEVTCSGEETMQYLRREGRYKKTRPPKPDLILLDLKMGGMDGFEVMNEMRKDPELAGIPVLALTGLEGHTDIKKAYDCGARGFVNKPIEPLDLVKAVLGMKEFGFEIVRA